MVLAKYNTFTLVVTTCSFRARNSTSFSHEMQLL